MTESPALEGDVLDVEGNVIEEAKKAFSVKGVARFVVGSSVKFVVTSTIASLVPAETRVEKAKVLVGAYVISGVVAEKAKVFISDDLEEKLTFCRDVYTQVQKLTASSDKQSNPEE